MSTFLDQYRQYLDGIVAEKQSQVAKVGNPDLASAYRLIGQYNSGIHFNNTTGAKTAAKKKHSAWNSFKSGGSRILDVMSRFNYASAAYVSKSNEIAHNKEKNFVGGGNDRIRPDDPGVDFSWGDEKEKFKALFRGLEGKDKKTYADVIRENGNDNKWVQGIVGFAGDVVLDPTTYMGIGPFVKAARLLKEGNRVGKAALEGAVTTPVGKAIEDAAQGSPIPKSAADKIEAAAVKIQGNPGAIFEPAPIQDVVKAAKPSAQVEELTARASKAAVQKLMGESKTLRYAPSTKIDEPFHTVKETPRKNLSSIQAKERAFYQRIINDDTFEVPYKGKKYSVADLRAKAKAAIDSGKPQIAHNINNLISEHASALAKKSPDYFGGQAQHIHFKSKTGNAAGSVTVEAFAKLLETGDVPKIGKSLYHTEKDLPTGGSPLDQFALHSTEDLGAFHVSTLLGDTKPLGEYLKRQGIKPHNVPVEGGLVSVSPSGSHVRRLAAFSAEEKKAWIAAHAERLDEEDIQTILNSKPSDYSATLATIMKKAGPTGFGSIDELTAAIKNGTISPEALDKLMKFTGVKSPDRIASKLEAIFKKVEDLDSKSVTSKTVDVPAHLENPAPIPKAQEVVSKAIETGDTSILSREIPTLDVTQQTDFKAAVQYLVQHEFLDPQDIEKYPFLSGKIKAKRTAAVENEGVGRKLNEWNEHSQYTVLNGFIKHAAQRVMTEIKTSGLKGPARRTARARAMRDHVMPVMRAVDNLLLENGIPPRLLKESRYTATLTDVLDSMPVGLVNRHMFDMPGATGGMHIPPQHWNELGQTMMDYQRGLITPTEAKEAIVHRLTSNTKTRSGKEIVSGVNSQYRAMNNAGREIEASKIVDDLANKFMEAAPKLAEKEAKNVATLAINGTNDANKISQGVMDQFINLVTSPAFSNVDALKFALDQDTIAKSVARARGISNPAAHRIASEDIAIKLAASLPPEVMTEATLGTRMANSSNKARTVGQKLDAAENAATDGQTLRDIGQRVEGTLTYRLMKAWAPHLKNSTVRPVYLQRLSPIQSQSRTYARMFNNVSKIHTTVDIKAAWRELQAGTIPEAGPVQDAMKDLSTVVGTMFHSDPKLNIFAREGLNVAHVNSFLKKYGIGDKFALKNPAEDWKTWDIEDPIAFMSKYRAAIDAALVERTTAGQLSHLFGVPHGTPGSIKINPSSDVLSRLLDPTKSFPKDLAEQISVLDRAMRMSRQSLGNNKLIRTYDEGIHMFKAGLTIYRPGHHIRNMIGDLTLSFFAGVNNPKVYKQAMRVMRDVKGRYDKLFDFDQFIKTGQLPLGVATDKISHTFVAGKRVDLTSGDVWRMAYEKGLLPDYRTLEDIGSETAGSYIQKIPKQIRQPFGGKVKDAAASFSEARDHYVRLAHFIHELENPSKKYKDIDSLSRDAAQKVHKWHPDGSDMTHFEKKYARRIFLFYSWIRKAIPLVVETAVMHPGKFLMPSKASYNLAVANGIQLNGFGDPYPEDQLFPSWMREDALGPQFGNNDDGYWRIDPGFPQVDVLNDYARSPTGALQAILGSTTPVLKVPGELVAGTYNRAGGGDAVAVDARTGVPKKDLSDYIDQNIPGINVVSNLLNRSASSGFTQRTGVGLGMSDTERQQATDKNPGVDTVGLLNWLTGAGLLDMSKPSYIKGAEKEQQFRTRR